jgi:hypothetical protein
MKNAERRLQLTSKFVQMGKALLDEGRDLNDPIIGQLGSMIIFLGGICFDDDDVIKFSDLVSMYSAKKIIESMEENQDPFLMKIRDKAENDTFDRIASDTEDLINEARKNQDNFNIDYDDDDDDDDDDEN